MALLCNQRSCRRSFWRAKQGQSSATAALLRACTTAPVRTALLENHPHKQIGRPLNATERNATQREALPSFFFTARNYFRRGSFFGILVANVLSNLSRFHRTSTLITITHSSIYTPRIGFRRRGWPQTDTLVAF